MKVEGAEIASAGRVVVVVVSDVEDEVAAWERRVIVGVDVMDRAMEQAKAACMQILRVGSKKKENIATRTRRFKVGVDVIGQSPIWKARNAACGLGLPTLHH